MHSSRGAARSDAMYVRGNACVGGVRRIIIIITIRIVHKFVCASYYIYCRPATARVCACMCVRVRVCEWVWVYECDCIPEHRGVIYIYNAAGRSAVTIIYTWWSPRGFYTSFVFTCVLGIRALSWTTLSQWRRPRRRWSPSSSHVGRQCGGGACSLPTTCAVVWPLQHVYIYTTSVAL